MRARASLIGECFGSYRLVRTIGRGSMGEVFEAEHVLLGRRAAVKVLLPELSHSQEAVSRFFNEARACATMHHDGLVQLFDFGFHDCGAYIVMELLDGETLTDIVDRRGHLPAEEAVGIARKVATAMASAHACGVVHRDLKPENLILVHDPDGGSERKLKVLDFGIAKLATATLFGATSTRPGQIMGTPAFMAPEQCHGASHVDERADIYALGCILYFMLTGRPPFVSDGVGATIAAQLYDEPAAPATIAHDLPARVDALVMRLLEKSPDERPASMDAVATLLAEVLDVPAPNTVILAEPSAAEPSAAESPRQDTALYAAAYAPTATDPCLGSLPSRSASLPSRSASLPSRSASLPSRSTSKPPRSTLDLASVALVPHAPQQERRRRHRRVGAAAACAMIALATMAFPSWRSLEAGAEPGEKSGLARVVSTRPSSPMPAAIVESPPTRLVTLRVRSRPAGAEVVSASDGRRLGVTPLDLEQPAGDVALALRVRKHGYASESIELPADRDALATVVLAPRARAKPVRAHALLAKRPKLTKPVKDGALDPFTD